MNNVLAGFLGVVLAGALVLLGTLLYKTGEMYGRNDVITGCVYYGKYAIDGTQFLLCSAIVKPDDMLPTVAETNAKYYSKENKEAHKKDRK